MFLKKNSTDTYGPKKPVSGKRIALWCAVLVMCILFSALVLASPDKIVREYNLFACQDQDYWPYEIAPGATVEQYFVAQGQSVGEVSDLYLYGFRDAASEGSVTVRLYREEDGEMLSEDTKDHGKFPGCEDAAAMVQQADALSRTSDSHRPPRNEISGALTTYVSFDAGFVLKSGETYCLEIINQSESDSLYLLGNIQVQSGKLLVDGEQQPGFLNLSWMRKSLYTPSRLLFLMVLLTDATVLLGLALVLFTDVKTHVLYLVLAVGFGIVTLFDLTPLYGFDMRFQFDSTYVLSNQMMGVDDAYWAADQLNEGEYVLSYYRRACDDDTQYQYYYHDEVSANYTDMKAGLRNLFAPEEDRELVLVETARGFVGEQLYLYFPQAVGFTIARLLGLSMYPMLQLARLIAYAVFVLTMYRAIRKVPFGKQIFLLLSLIPTVMVQTISLSRDAMIICMSFYIIAKTMQMAYALEKPKLWDWAKLLTISILLAPCKMIYLPVSCLFLIVLYRHYMLPAGDKWKKIALWAVLLSAVVIAVFVWLNADFFRGMFSTTNISVYNTEAYSVLHLLTDPLNTLYVLANTLRTELGAYLVNAVQLFDIDLGCSDGITIIVFALMVLSSCSEEPKKQTLCSGERGFMLLVAVGVFLLTAVASMLWTPVTSNVIIGLQGRYLTPILPLLCLACCNNRVVHLDADVSGFVSACCCVFPAISLMNMYLWAITC